MIDSSCFLLRVQLKTSIHVDIFCRQAVGRRRWGCAGACSLLLASFYERYGIVNAFQARYRHRIHGKIGYDMFLQQIDCVPLASCNRKLTQSCLPCVLSVERQKQILAFLCMNKAWLYVYSYQSDHVSCSSPDV